MTLSTETRRRQVRRAGLAATALLGGATPRRAAAQADDAGTITVTGISSFGLIQGFIPRFTERTGIKVNPQILPYP